MRTDTARLRGLALWVPLVLTPVISAQTPDQLTPHPVKLESVDYRGKRAVKVVEDGPWMGRAKGKRLP